MSISRNNVFRPRRAGFVFTVLWLLSFAPAWGNPFLSGGKEDSAVPTVRSPASGGPLIDAQRGLRERTASALRAFREDRGAGPLLALLGSAFLYGVLHAAGPGHRKTVVFSLFLGRKASFWEPAAAGFLAAGVHAGAGVALVGALSALRGAVAGLGETERTGALLDGATFGLLALASLALAAGKVIRLVSRRRAPETAPRRGGLYGIVALSSLVPCPGAMMLLLFALYADAAAIGVAAVAALSLGMGVVISLAGYLAYAGREGLFARLKSGRGILQTVSDGLELLSYVLILGFSLYMAIPFYRALLG